MEKVRRQLKFTKLLSSTVIYLGLGTILVLQTRKEEGCIISKRGRTRISVSWLLMGVFFSPLDMEYFMGSDGNRHILVFWERRYLSFKEMYLPMLSTSLSRNKTFSLLHKVQLLPSPKERSVLSPQISFFCFRSSQKRNDTLLHLVDHLT